MYKLYGRRGSGSMAPEMIMTYAGLPFEIVETSGEAAREPSYLSLCPNARVPAMVLPDGEAIFESAAICIHLTNRHPEAGLAPPPGTTAHARYLQWMVYLSSEVYGGCRHIYHADFFVEEEARDAPQLKRRALVNLEEAFGILDRAIGSGNSLLDGLSAADFYLYMLLTWHPEGLAGVAARYQGIARMAKAVDAIRSLESAISNHT